MDGNHGIPSLAEYTNVVSLEYEGPPGEEVHAEVDYSNFN